MKKIIISFLLSAVLFFNVPVTVQASSAIDFGNEILLSNADMGNMLRWALENIGIILNPSLWQFSEY